MFGAAGRPAAQRPISSTSLRSRRHTTAESPTTGGGPVAESAKDAAEWKPSRHGAWFAQRVIEVKLEYELTIDPAERDALEALLASGGAQLNCVG